MSFPFDVSTLPHEKGCRLFVQCGATTYYGRGFRSKGEASMFINRFGSALDWRSGYLFKLKGDDRQVMVVDRKGKEPRL